MGRSAQCAGCGPLWGCPQAVSAQCVGLTGWVGTLTLCGHNSDVSLEKLAKRARSMPEDALFSGGTAAWLHGLDFPPCEPIEVTLPRLSETSHLAGVRLTRSDFTASEACRARGFPATSRTRTIADLARRNPLVEAVVILDMALRRGLVSIDELRTWVHDHPRHRGIGRLVEAMEMADPRSESPMESRVRAHLVIAGLPKPIVQQPLDDESGGFIGRPDLYYAHARLAIEYDGASHRDSFAADNRRQNRLIEAGYRVLRFTAGDILHRPAAVVGQVERALAYSIGSPN